MKWRDRISILSRKRRQQNDLVQAGSDLAPELGHTANWSGHVSHHHHIPGGGTSSSSNSPSSVESTLAQVRPVIGPDHKSYYILLRGTGDSFTCIQPAKEMLDSLDEVMKNVMSSVEVDKMAEHRLAIEQQQNHYEHHHHKPQEHHQQQYYEQQQQQHTITTCTTGGGKSSVNSSGSSTCSTSSSTSLAETSAQHSPSTAISATASRMRIITRNSEELGGRPAEHPTTVTMNDRSRSGDPIRSMDLLDLPLHLKTGSLSEHPDPAHSSPNSIVKTEKPTRVSPTHIKRVAGGGDSRRIVSVPTLAKITNPEHFVKLLDVPSHTKSVSTSNSKRREKESMPLLTKIVACTQPTLKFPMMPLHRKNAVTTRKQSQKLYELLSRRPRHSQAATTRPYPSEPCERKQSETTRWKKDLVQSSVCQSSPIVLQRLNGQKQQQQSLEQSVVLSSDKVLSVLQNHLNGQLQQQQQSIETGVMLSSDKTLPVLQNRLSGQKLQQQQNVEPQIALLCDREPTEMYDTSDSVMDSVILNRLLQNLDDDSSEQSVGDHNTTKITTTTSASSLIYSTIVQTKNNNNNITGNHKSVVASSRSSSSNNSSTKHTKTTNNKVPESCLVVSSVQYEDEDDEPESLAMTQVDSESIPDSCTLYETSAGSTEIGHDNERTHGQNEERHSSPEMLAAPEFSDVHRRDRLQSRTEMEAMESPTEPLTEIQLLAREGTVLTEEHITEQIKSMIDSEQLIVQENHHLVAMRVSPEEAWVKVVLKGDEVRVPENKIQEVVADTFHHQPSLLNPEQDVVKEEEENLKEEMCESFPVLPQDPALFLSLYSHKRPDIIAADAPKHEMEECERVRKDEEEEPKEEEEVVVVAEESLQYMSNSQTLHLDMVDFQLEDMEKIESGLLRDEEQIVVFQQEDGALVNQDGSPVSSELQYLISNSQQSSSCPALDHTSLLLPSGPLVHPSFDINCRL